MATRRSTFRLLPLAACIGALCAHDVLAATAPDQLAADHLATNTANRLITNTAIQQLRPLTCNPPLNSVRAAHGNTDWHIDTANEFLFGVEMDGDPSAANHVPNTWTRQHIHVDQTHTGDYYRDNTVDPGGLDTNVDHGIDKTMLFFYAGHGSPTSWDTLGDWGTQSDMLLGNCGNGGRTRYYWQCSCEVFAHGPDTCSSGGTAFEYSCPEEFDGSADSHGMRNVYERWGPALDSRLRMACGASTPAYCHEDQMNRIWDNYNNLGYDVADAFIFGLHGSSGSDSNVVPLCITTGGWNTASTPLYDTSFTNLPNPSGDYLHIQYLSSFDSTAPHFRLPEIPRWIPRLRLILPEPAPILEQIKLVQQGPYLVAEARTQDGRPMLKVDTRSQAMYLNMGLKSAPAETRLSKEDYVELARKALEASGLNEPDMGEPEVTRVMVQRVWRRDTKQVDNLQKSVLVTFPRVLKTRYGAVPVLGDGSRMQIQYDSEGRLMRFHKVWRKAAIQKEMLKVKPYEQAYREALEQVGRGARYELRQVEFGYRSESGNVAQEQVAVVYRFAFHPEQSEKEELPPRIVEIPAI
jgi:hypothetical protein